MLRTACSALSMIVAGLATSPAGAQRQTHGAGVSWSGSHGGVSWDGGHAYEGGSYGGYPAVPPPPAYRPPPPAYRMVPPLADPIEPLQANPSRHGRPRDPDRAGKAGWR